MYRCCWDKSIPSGISKLVVYLIFVKIDDGYAHLTCLEKEIPVLLKPPNSAALPAEIRRNSNSTVQDKK